MNPESYRMERLCWLCAQTVYREAPSDEYARRVQTLLFMTGAHESGGWKWRRQRGYDLEDTGGAFSYWQLEWPWIHDRMKWLQTQPALFANAARFIGMFGLDQKYLLLGSGPDVRLVLQREQGDALAVCHARLHYLRRPGAIPVSLAGQALYAKRHYNTRLGKARPADYGFAFMRHWPGGVYPYRSHSAA